MTFKALDGPAAVTALRVEAVRGGRRYVAKSAAGRLVVTVLDRPCADGMSGMPYPNTVTVVVHGREYRGCGGEPASLLRAGEWTVEAIDGVPLAPGSRATIRFGSDGRVSGDASCNTYADR